MDTDLTEKDDSILINQNIQIIFKSSINIILFVNNNYNNNSNNTKIVRERNKTKQKNLK